MPKSVNVVLNSNNAIAGTDTRSLTYFIDWDAILDRKKKYHLHFVYMGGANTYTGTKLPTIYATFNTENYLPNITGTINTQMLGVLMPTVLAGASSTSFFQSLDNTNLPIFMNTPPNNNTFTISILDNQATPVGYLDNAGTPNPPAPYVLILRFSEVEDSDM